MSQICPIGCRIGDKGQRYEVRYTDKESEKIMGWTEDPKGFPLVESIKLHPCWHSPRVLDRKKEEE